MATGTSTIVATPVGLLSRLRPKYLLFGFIGLMLPMWPSGSKVS